MDRDRRFESSSLQQTVGLSPDFSFLCRLPAVRVVLTSPVRLCRPCRLAGAAHTAATAGFSTQEGEIWRERDCPLEGTGFEPIGPARVKGLSALADERCRTDKLDGVIKHTSSRETTMVGRGASLEGRLFLGGTDGSNPVPSSGESDRTSSGEAGGALGVCTLHPREATTPPRRALPPVGPARPAR